MIRKQIIFQVEDKSEISYNYQHEILKNFYNLTKVADENKAKILHNKGYRLESGHIFKLINFTLLFENAIFTENNIVLTESTVIKLIMSGKKENIELFLKGLIVEQQMVIEDVILKFVGVIDDKKVFFKEVMLYKALSPIITTTKENLEKVYLDPYQLQYYENLALNAKRKYKLVYGKEYEGEIFFEIDDLFIMKEKFVRIKQGGVKGHTYNIWIQADKDMQKIIYYLGLGQNSSIGCGCLSIITGVSEDA